MKTLQKRSFSKWYRGQTKSLWIIPAIGLFIKFIIISEIPGNFWLGADGENYIKGLEFLIRDGFLSTESILHYWPAGYPLLMWIVGAEWPQLTLLLMAILQSLLYAFATAYFCQKINETSLKKFSFTAALLLTVNPTLSLNTIAIGYELISASVFLLVIALFVSLYNTKKRTFWSWQLITAGLLFSVTNFVQPRYFLSALIYFVVVALFLYPRKLFPFVLIIGTTLSLVLPSLLVIRNAQANNFSSVSTNFGRTMQLGAGDGATGGYVPTFQGVECPQGSGNAAEIDRELVACVIDWYLENPTELMRLAFNKSIFFWSPWFGPVANGSMARNPWVKLNPFYGVASESEEGFRLVYGSWGEIASWAWMLGYLTLLTLGVFSLWNMGGVSKQISILLTSLVLSNWIISLGTLGDHRQRVPVMTMIVFLQLVGFSSLLKKRNSRRR